MTIGVNVHGAQGSRSIVGPGLLLVVPAHFKVFLIVLLIDGTSIEGMNQSLQ